MNESNEDLNVKTQDNPKRFHYRGFFSLLLFSSFSILLFSGVILYFTPKGRVAHWTGWTMLGLEKEEWSSIHIVLSLIVIVSAGFHLYYNWTIFWCYITHKAQATLNLKREITLALLICVVTFVGTLYEAPPFSTIIKWNDAVKVYWETHSARAPKPNTEEFSIKRLANEVDMPLDQVIERLEEAGIPVEDPSITVKELGKAHGLAPSQLFAIVQPEYRGGGGGGRGMGGGGQGGGGS
ncbi:MAG: DUF4405 domain-containing protein [Candidatus Hydrogenedentota bacterium]